MHRFLALLMLFLPACRGGTGSADTQDGTDGSSGQPTSTASSGTDASDSSSGDTATGTSGGDPEACVVFVDAAAGDDENHGFDWANAKRTLSEALEVAAPDQCPIWMAGGVYHPTMGLDRATAFELFPGARVYGGFNGSESSLDDRDPAQVETVLSGDIGALGDRGDNSHHVVLGADEALLDGLVIEEGNTGLGAGQAADVVDGAGLLIVGARMAVSNTVFRNNAAAGSGPAFGQVAGAGGSGGAIFAFNSSLEVTNSRFESNVAGNGAAGLDTGGSGGSGGAIAFQEGEALTIRESVFVDNTAGAGGDGRTFGGLGGSGGAVRFVGADLRVEDCTFDGNGAGPAGETGAAVGSTGGAGGAVAVVLGRARIDRSRFVGNASGSGGASSQTGGDGGPGGALSATAGADLSVVRSVFEGNSTAAGGVGQDVSGADGAGGALSLSSGEGATWIASSIFHSNRAGGVDPTGSLGGAIAVIESVGAGPLHVVNASFSNNRAAAGGAIYVLRAAASSAGFVGTAFGGNIGETSAGAVLVECPGPRGHSPAEFVNSVLWGDSSPLFPEVESRCDTTAVVVRESSLEGGCAPTTGLECGEGVVEIDPEYVELESADLRPTGDVLADLGDDAAVPTDAVDLDDDGDVDETLPFDLAENPRIVGRVDIGPYELR